MDTHNGGTEVYVGRLGRDAELNWKSQRIGMYREYCPIGTEAYLGQESGDLSLTSTISQQSLASILLDTSDHA
jgi:hypothetical protein